MPTTEVQIVYSAGGQFYAIADVARECGLWLSVAKHPLPVPPEWRRPGFTFAAVMRGRSYYRIGSGAPQNINRSATIGDDDEMVKDWRDAAWWTLGLEESWVELQGMKEALARATALHVCESGETRRGKEKHHG